MRKSLGLIGIVSGLVIVDAPRHGSHGQEGTVSNCELVEQGWGPVGTVALKAEKVLTGLEVPWGIAFLPNGDWLIPERPGRIRLVQAGRLVPEAVATVSVGEAGEGGLLGITLDPRFGETRAFFVFYTANKNGETVNRVQRYVLSEDHKAAAPSTILLDDVAAGAFHDGGRIKFGPDGKLYIGTGDARDADSAQDSESVNGKILRINADGTIPADNPFPGSPVFMTGVRNPQAFDWVNDSLLIIADHGPTGDLGLSGRDEVSFANAGANLGWPLITGCEAAPGLVQPAIAWNEAAPPGGGVIYRGGAIPEFAGNFLVAMLGIGSEGAMQLHRIVFDAAAKTVTSHEMYLRGEFGRLRDVAQAPDGTLYVTTSNCDSRGSCPLDGDAILRITHE